MALVKLDCMGLKCPQPVLKVAVKATEMQKGDILEVAANCESFPKDVKAWCERTKKTLLFCRDEGGGKSLAQIQF
jgi:tRNA 2-thiouridine synthesizing protein A